MIPQVGLGFELRVYRGVGFGGLGLKPPLKFDTGEGFSVSLRLNRGITDPPQVGGYNIIIIILIIIIITIII